MRSLELSKDDIRNYGYGGLIKVRSRVSKNEEGANRKAGVGGACVGGKEGLSMADTCG